MKKILFACLLLVASIHPHRAQDLNPDSLIKSFNREKQDTLKVKTGLRITNHYLSRGLSDSAFYYGRQTLLLAKTAGYNKGIANAYNFLGQAFNYTGKPDSALRSFNEAFAIFKKLEDIKRQGWMLNNKGIIYHEIGNFQKALDCYFEALRIKEYAHDSSAIAGAYVNIGQLYSEMKDTVNTLKYYRAGFDLYKKVGDASGACIALGALGSYYQNQNQFSTALKYLNEALRISELLQEEESIAITCYNIANVYYKQKKTDLALALYEKALLLSRKNHNARGICICLQTMGQVSYETGKNALAVKQLQEAYTIAKEINAYEELGEISAKLSEALEKSGDFKGALLMLKEARVIKDSIFNKSNVRKLTSEGLKFEHEKEKLLLQKEQEKKEALAAADAKRKNIMIIAALVFLIFVIAFSYVLYRRLVENRKQKEIIEEQRAETLASINYAKRIQYALLAHEDLLKQYLPNYFVLFKPKDIVSGDFYWATLHGNNFYLAVCDCTGHGVPGAFMSLLNISFLNEAINEKNIEAPGEVLNYVRKKLIASMDGGKDGMDAVLIKLPVNRGKEFAVEYAAANNSLLVLQNGLLHEQAKDKMPVGVGEIKEEFKTYTLSLRNGDALYLYTDGFADQFGGPKGKKFKYKQLDETLLNHASQEPETQKETLLKIFEAWRGKLEQVDDVTVMALKF